MTMQNVNEPNMDYALGVARQVCARVFRDGGAPADALEAFGMAHEDVAGSWRDAVDAIAMELCRKQVPEPAVFKRAA